MSYVISVYTKNAFKDFNLPAINNSDYQIIIKSEEFKLLENIVLKLEVLDNSWRFMQSEDYSVTEGGRMFFDINIKNGDFLKIVSKYGEELSVIISQTQRNFPVFMKYKMISNQITVGSDSSNGIQYDSFGLVSRFHAVITRVNNEYVIEGKGINGVFVGSHRIQNSEKLMYGDCINIFGMKIVFLGNVIAIMAYNGLFKVSPSVLKKVAVASKKEEKQPRSTKVTEEPYFHRSPRAVNKINCDEIYIEDPPAPPKEEKRPLILTIGPSLTMAIPMLLGCLIAMYAVKQRGGMGGAFMYTGIVTAVSSAIIGTIWALVNLRYSKKILRENEETRFDLYSKYLIDTANNIKALYDENYRALWNLYPLPQTLCTYSKNRTMLWNRNIMHDDFLALRLGVGDMPFQVKIHTPKKKFSLIYDSLAEKPKQIAANFEMLKGVPICADLYKERLIGVVGDDNRAVNIVQNLMCQIAANNCYTDVKLVLLCDASRSFDRWDFAKWLPHTWSDDRKMRYIASTESERRDVIYELTNKLRTRVENDNNTGDDVKPILPHYVLIVDNPAILESDAISKYVFDTESNCGMTTIILSERCEELPNQCSYIIQNDDEFSGKYNLFDDINDRTPIKFDNINAADLDKFSREISGIRVNQIESGTGLPTALDFFEMHGVSKLEDLKVYDRWRKSRTYDTMKALIGVKTGGSGCYLDIHEKYHGPHGLVAGTTGSGKSETLQTYILSLAVEYSPDDVAFFIIDFKGGGMANLFSDLPHLVGKITNLSGNQVYRAMVSIKSECKRRQKLLGEYGVNNINAYTKLIKNAEASIPMPHLFIIIDEFAELKREEPEFMSELISVAQIGRSLGVHLILATQKPSGTVDDNIWSNSKFKLCLRVQDRQDSNDMLHKPDAAYITQAGRCYLQVGNDEIFELFQSGYSGGEYDDDNTKKTELAKMLDITGRAALVGNRTQIKYKALKKIKWLTELAEIILEAAEQCNIEIVAARQNRQYMDRLIEEVFILADKRKFDYQKSVYNTNRLMDFIQLWDVSPNTYDTDIYSMVEKACAFAKENSVKLPEAKQKSQLDAVVEYLHEIAATNGYVNSIELWLPPLSTNLYLEDIDGFREDTAYESQPSGADWSIEAIVGLCDDPVNQTQYPLVLNISGDGHHAICGTVVSGKSTFLQTLIYSLVTKYSPQYINIYILDFSNKMLSAYEGLAHVGGVMYENDEEKISKFFNMLQKIIAERKKLLKSGNYAQYVRANGVTMPAVLVFIDNYAAFREKTGDAYERVLMSLARDGAAYGIYLIITSAGFGSVEIQTRIGDYIRRVICLEMGDKYKYGDALHTMKFNVLPEPGIRGRGIADVGGSFLEFQTALVVNAADDYEKSRRIAEKCKEINSLWKGETAREIPVIPEKPVWSQFEANTEFNEAVSNIALLPVGYNLTDASIACVDLSRAFSYCIVGKSGTGKRNMLKVMLRSAMNKDADIAVIDFAKELEDIIPDGAAEYITDYEKMFEYWQNMVGEFADRGKLKRELTKKYMSDDEIFTGMSKKRQKFVFITNMSDFINQVYDAANTLNGDMRGFIENITEKGKGLNIYFISVINTDNLGSMPGNRTFINLTTGADGALLGGNPNQQRIFDFSALPFAEQSRAAKPGLAYIAPQFGEAGISKYIIPLYGR